MLCTTRASLLSSTRKQRYSFLASYGSLRNLSTVAGRLGFVNPSYGTPVDNSPQDSYAQSLNPGYGNGFYQNQDQSVSFGESSGIFNKRGQIWQSSDGGSSFGNGIRNLHENAQSQSWDSYNGGHSQSTNHFEQEGSGNGSLDKLDTICREGKVKTGVEIIKSWRNNGYVVDLPRLLWLAKLCGDAQALEEAKVVHEFITSSVFLSDISVYNSVIEMYAGCESVEDALTVFDSMPEKNSETCEIARTFNDAMCKIAKRVFLQTFQLDYLS